MWKNCSSARARYGTTTASTVTPVSGHAATRRRGREQRPERISVTREELEALIEEAVRKDRALR